MSGIDIFYLSLVLVAFTGYAAALAYFVHADARFRAERGSEPARRAPKAAAAKVMMKAA
jgi:hypothetical protein